MGLTCRGVVEQSSVQGGGAAAEEAVLLARVAAGDRGLPLEDLFRRYAGRLYGLGLALLGDAGLAEELVQESFVRLWRQAPRFDPQRGTVATFVFAVARHVAVDLWRRPSSRPLGGVPNGTGGGPALEDPAPGVVDGVVVRRALDELSSAHRQVLALSYAGGLTQSQIADLLGVPLGTVKTRTYHALRALKVALEAQGVDA